MFGISWAEFFVILLVGVVVIPARMWPDVARALARAVNFVRSVIWRITDASEDIKRQIELEQPIDDLLRTTTDQVLDAFSDVRPKKQSPVRQKISGARKK